MSQFGMQMPGGRASGGPTPDVFTALMFIGIVFMLAAVVVLWFAATRVSPAAHPFAIQKAGQIKLKG